MILRVQISISVSLYVSVHAAMNLQVCVCNPRPSCPGGGCGSVYRASLHLITPEAVFIHSGPHSAFSHNLDEAL